MQQINFLRGTPADEALIPVSEFFTHEFPKVFQKYGDRILQYQSPGLTDFLGFHPLKEILAERFGPTGDPQKRILCTNGGMETFSLLMKSLPSKSQIATDALTYDRVLADMKHLGHLAVGVPFCEEGTDVQALQKTLAQGDIQLFYQVAYHHNPLGITTSLDNLSAVSEICAQNHVLHVMDIAYYELRYDGSANQLLDLAKYPETTAILGSFTKTLSPGAKCGFGIFPEKVIKRLTPVVANSRLNPNYPTQAAIHNLIKSGLYDEHLRFLIDLYKPRMESMNAALQQHLPEINAPELTGGFFVGIWLPEISDAAQFIQTVKSKCVIISQNNVFAPGWKEYYRNKGRGAFFRLTFPANSPQENELGIAIIAETYQQLK
ncbi:MAG: aminotransferase class I/II-fold pyridoxal phosphate-dependent enzyme [bacterium]